MNRIRVLAGSLILLPFAAHAQGIIVNGIAGCSFSNGALRAACIPNFVAHLIQFVFGLIGVFFLGSVIVAGYQMATSGITGDKESGKRRLTWSIIGLFVSICAFVIIDMFIAVIVQYTP